jgi:hypothetical protein
MGTRRSDAIFCRTRCKRRYYRRRTQSNYLEPPSARTDPLSEYRADRHWQRLHAAHEQAAQPLSPEQRVLLQRQKRNPGVLLPELAAMQLARAIEAQRREQAETYDQAFAVQDPVHNPDPTVLARRGRLSRRGNRHLAADPHLGIMRPSPGRSGPHDWYDDNECIDGNAIGWRR